LPRKEHVGWRPIVALSSGGEGKLVERDADSIMEGHVDGKLVVAAAKVLHKREPGPAGLVSTVVSPYLIPL
jgi:hypothetical protein